MSFFAKNGNIKLFYVLFTVFLFVLFGLKDILILVSKTWPHLYALVNVPTITWEEVYCYFPSASHFDLRHLMPAAPMADPSISKLTFLPFITFMVQGIIFKYVCFSNIDAFFLLSHTVLPIGSFWIIFLIFRRYISPSWSLLMAFLGVMHYSNFSLFAYFGGLIKDPSLFISGASLAPMELTRTPVPSVTLLCFAFTFYLSIRKQRFSFRRYLFLSLMWAINIYVYLFNFVAGIAFWLPYMIFSHYIANREWNLKDVTKIVASNLVVILAVISPVIFMRFVSFTPLDADVFQRMNIVGRELGLVVSSWGIFLSYVLPVLAVAAVIWIYCADYYEMFYVFTPVLIMIVVEIIISNLHLITGHFFQPYLFTLRISNFFLRYFYFIPIIYFLSQPSKQLFHEEEKNRFSVIVRRFFNEYVIRHGRIIVALGVLLISFFSVFSSLKYYNQYSQNACPRMADVSRQLVELTGQSGEGLLVSDDIAVNMLLPVVTDRSSILVNGFSNYVASDEIMDRIALFAKIYNWDRQMFLDFIMPSDVYKNIYFRNSFVITDELLRKGFGYLLVNAGRHMDAAQVERYKTEALKVFDGYNVKEGIKKYNINAIQAGRPINGSIDVKTSVRKGQKTVHIL